jgi:hypothetical protein
MVIVSPGWTQFARLALQIEIRDSTAPQFFAEHRSVKMTPLQKIEQAARALVRPRIERNASKKWQRSRRIFTYPRHPLLKPLRHPLDDFQRMHYVFFDRLAA